MFQILRRATKLDVERRTQEVAGELPCFFVSCGKDSLEFGQIPCKHPHDVGRFDCDRSLDVTSSCLNGKLGKQDERLCNSGNFT